VKLLCASQGKANLRWICTGLYHEVVLEIGLIAVPDHVDSVPCLAIHDSFIGGNVRVPLFLIVANQIIDFPFEHRFTFQTRLCTEQLDANYRCGWDRRQLRLPTFALSSPELHRRPGVT